MAVGIAFHILAALIWVGGLWFAAMVLRPAAESLDPATRLTLWHRVLGRFFPLVWVSIAVLLASGVAMVFIGFGGFAGISRHIRLMAGIGFAAVAAFAYLHVVPWRAFGKAVAAQNWSVAAKSIIQIRLLIIVNLILGAAAVLIGASGRYYG